MRFSLHIPLLKLNDLSLIKKIKVLILFLIILNLPKVSQSDNKKQLRKIKKQEKKYLKQGWHSPPYITMSKELSRLKYYQKSSKEDKFFIGKGHCKGTDFFYVRNQARINAKLNISQKIDSHIQSLTKIILNASTKNKETLSNEKITTTISIDAKNVLIKETLHTVFEAYRINKSGKIEVTVYLVYPILKSDELFFRNLPLGLNDKESFRTLMNVDN